MIPSLTILLAFSWKIERHEAHFVFLSNRIISGMLKTIVHSIRLYRPKLFHFIQSRYYRQVVDESWRTLDVEYLPSMLDSVVVFFALAIASITISVLRFFLFCLTLFPLPTIMFCFVLPFRMELSHVLLRDKVEVFLIDLLAFRIVVYTAASVALDDVLPEQTDGLIGDLSLPGSLFRC